MIWTLLFLSRRLLPPVCEMDGVLGHHMTKVQDWINQQKTRIVAGKIVERHDDVSQPDEVFC